MERYIQVMGRQLQDLIYLTKLQIMLDEDIIPKWGKRLHTHELSSLKTAKTHIGKVLTSLQGRMDNDSLKKYVFNLLNTNMLNIPKKEVKQALDLLERDTRLLDIAVSHCDPCTMKDSGLCDIRKVLDDGGYPAMWDDDNINIIELVEEERRLKAHCRHCVNIKEVE